MDAGTVLFSVLGTEYDAQEADKISVLSSPQRFRGIGYISATLLVILIYLTCYYRYLSILSILAKLYIAGVDISWKQFHTSLSLTLRKVELPFYPFQHQRYWYPPYDKPDTALLDSSIC